MIGYVSVGTNDIAEAGRFYDALLGEMGVPGMGTGLEVRVLYGASW